jgi:3,2-trans-enoyl-CoA isomerase
MMVVILYFRFQDAMINTLGHRQTELSLQLGQMYTNKEALDIKLVDQIVPGDIIMRKAKEEMERWLKIPGDFIYKISKRNKILQW